MAESSHMQQLLAQTRAMEDALSTAAADLAETVVEGRSQDNKVKLRLSGSFEFVRLRITPGALEEENLKHLEKSVAEAVADALTQAHALAAARSTEVFAQ